MEMLHTLLVVVATSKVVVYVCQNSQDYTFKGCFYYMQIIPQISLKLKRKKKKLWQCKQGIMFLKLWWIKK